MKLVGRIVAIAICFIVIVLSPGRLQAGCKSDCEDNYQYDKEQCLLIYDTPDDADALQMCLDNAGSDYDNCIEECES